MAKQTKVTPGVKYRLNLTKRLGDLGIVHRHRRRHPLHSLSLGHIILGMYGVIHRHIFLSHNTTFHFTSLIHFDVTPWCADCKSTDSEDSREEEVPEEDMLVEEPI